MNKVKIVCIGCGSWAKRKYLPYLRSRNDVEIVAASSLISKDEKRQMIQLLPDLKIFDSAEEMLDSVKPDGAIVSIPHALIFENLLKCVQKKIPVMTDKPFTTSFSEASQVLSLSAKKGVSVGVCHQRRAFPHISRIKELFENQELDPIRWVHASMFLHSYPDWLSGWRNNPSLSGNIKLHQGILLDAGYHILDSILYLLNFELPQRVYCVGSSRDANVETDISATLEFSQEKTVTIMISRNYPQSCDIESIEILGDSWLLKGKIEELDGKKETLFQRYSSENLVESTSFDVSKAVTAPIESFINHLHGEPLPTIWSAETSLATMKVLEALYSSLDTHQIVQVEK